MDTIVEPNAKATKATKATKAATKSKVLKNSTAEPPISKLRQDYLIQARWKHASFIRQVIDSIKDLMSYINMDWDTAGIRIQGMDDAHVALSNIFISSEDCEYYHVREGITVGAYLYSMSKILAIAEPTDSCEFFIKSDLDSNLSIKFQSEDGSKEALFEIPLLDIETELLEIPEKDYDNEVRIASSEVPTTIRDMSFLGDSVEFTVNFDEFKLKIQGENGKGQRSWKSTTCKILMKNNEERQLIQRFHINYIIRALKATSTTQTLLLEFSANNPLRITCMFGQKSSIINFLAPKIEDDD